APVAGERRADLTGADDADVPPFAETKYLAELLGQLGNGVAEPSFAEGAEEREIFAHLSRCGAAEPGELVARDGSYALALDPLEKAQIEREAPDCRFRDPLQIVLVK